MGQTKKESAQKVNSAEEDSSAAPAGTQTRNLSITLSQRAIWAPMISTIGRCTIGQSLGSFAFVPAITIPGKMAEIFHERLLKY